MLSLYGGLIFIMTWAAAKGKNGIVAWFLACTAPSMTIWGLARRGIGSEYFIAQGERFSQIAAVYGLMAFFVGVTVYTIFKTDPR